MGQRGRPSLEVGRRVNGAKCCCTETLGPFTQDILGTPRSQNLKWLGKKHFMSIWPLANGAKCCCPGTLGATWVPKPCKSEIKQRSVDGEDQEQRAFREKKHFPSLPGLRKPLSKSQKWGISLVYSPLLLILRLMFPEPGKYCRKFHISTFLVTFSYLKRLWYSCGASYSG